MMEKAVVFNYLKDADFPKATDSMYPDCLILETMWEDGIQCNKSLLQYHRKVVLGIPGRYDRFDVYRSEWEETNVANQTPAK